MAVCKECVETLGKMAAEQSVQVGFSPCVSYAIHRDDGARIRCGPHITTMWYSKKLRKTRTNLSSENREGSRKLVWVTHEKASLKTWEDIWHWPWVSKISIKPTTVKSLTIYAHWFNSAMNVIGMTKYFLLDLRPTPKNLKLYLVPRTSPRTHDRVDNKP